VTELFLDTSYAIALSSPPDQYHEPAVAIAVQIEAQQRRLLTTRAVMLEIANALAKRRYRAGAVRLLQAMEHDPAVEIVPLTEELYAQAMRMYGERPDKEWGLTDCVSFVVMRERELTEALTADEHFRQAGFRALLLDA
jgi:predicted nucleic acid-binding protein